MTFKLEGTRNGTEIENKYANVVVFLTFQREIGFYVTQVRSLCLMCVQIGKKTSELQPKQQMVSLQILIPSGMVVALSWIIFWIEMPMEDQVVLLCWNKTCPFWQLEEKALTWQRCTQGGFSLESRCLRSSLERCHKIPLSVWPKNKNNQNFYAPIYSFLQASLEVVLLLTLVTLASFSQSDLPKVSNLTAHIYFSWLLECISVQIGPFLLEVCGTESLLHLFMSSSIPASIFSRPIPGQAFAIKKSNLHSPFLFHWLTLVSLQECQDRCNNMFLSSLTVKQSLL